MPFSTVAHDKRLWYAFEFGRKQAVVSGRGNGLLDVLSFAQRKNASELMVRSCKGVYHSSYTGNYHKKGDRSLMNVELHGTLVEWRIPV